MINEQLWIGHFDLWIQQGIVMFRHALVLTGGIEASGRQCKSLLSTALDCCGRYLRLPVRGLGRQGRQGGARRRHVETRARRERLIRPGMTRKTPLSCGPVETCPKKPLAKFPGRLVLLGAGKMGLALLEGWLARGLGPRKVTVIEPHPAKAVKALVRRGLKLNPKTESEATAIVIAVKPQTAHEALPALEAYAGKRTLALSIMAGRPLRFADALPAGRRWCAPCRTRRPPSAAASPWPCPMPMCPRASASTPVTCSPPRQRRMGERRGADGRGHRRLGIRPGLCVPAGGGDDASGDRRRPAGRRWPRGSRARRWPAPASSCTAPSSKPRRLRQNVTSPGGTTAAALSVLMGPGGFERLLTEAIAAATRRSRELAG